MTKSGKGGNANYGIQGEGINIQAKALALGPGARASNTEYGTQTERDVIDAIGEIQAALEQLNVRPALRAEITADLAKLPPMAKNPDEASKPAREAAVKTVISKLGMVGIAIKETSQLIDPLTKLIGALQIARMAVGL